MYILLICIVHFLKLVELVKVQKRGSVGRTIDVNRYKGYDELRNDLARMFGIEGLLEDPQRTEWKLVYVDHENDILLVGDDPWEYVLTKKILVFSLFPNHGPIFNFLLFVLMFVQRVRELCPKHKDTLRSRGTANEPGRRFSSAARG